MIAIQNLVKKFGGFTALDGVNLSIGEGTVTALIGPSGSGKSTLLRCINLLEIPQSGSLGLDGDVLEFHPHSLPHRNRVLKLRRKTGMVLQSFQLFPHQTVLENIMESLRTVQRWKPNTSRDRANELLAKVGLPDKGNAYPATLSGGQQQRVAIARALAPSPKILLCDEPTSALDPELAVEVVDVLNKLADEGVTMLMATHDLRLAATTARNVVFLDGGNIIESGSPQEIFIHPKQSRTASFISALSHTSFDSWDI